MATTLKRPTDRRGGEKLTDTLHRLSRRERIAALAIAVVLLLLLAVGVGSAVGGGVPFMGDDEEARGASRLPADWAGIEPLLPLAPSLKDVAALKRSAAGEASGVLAAESGRGGGGRRGALRVRALPEGAGGATGGGARVAAERRPSGRPRPAAVGAPAPTLVRVPSVRRILATRLNIDLGVTNELREIIDEDLRNLTGLPIDIDIGSLPGIGGGRGPLTLTVVDSETDSRFDILLVARGRRLIEAYRFRDRDIAGLAAQINLRSSVLVADLLRDGRRLARVTAAPLRSDPAGPGSGLLGTGLAAGASRDGAGIGAGPTSLASARSGAQGRPTAGSRREASSRGRSAGGARSSGSLRSGAGASTPRRSTAPRPATRSGPRGTSAGPKLKKLKPLKHAGHPKRPSGGGGSFGHGKHGKGHGKHGKGHGKHGKGHGKHGKHGKGDDDDGDD